MYSGIERWGIAFRQTRRQGICCAVGSWRPIWLSRSRFYREQSSGCTYPREDGYDGHFLHTLSIFTLRQEGKLWYFPESSLEKALPFSHGPEARALDKAVPMSTACIHSGSQSLRASSAPHSSLCILGFMSFIRHVFCRLYFLWILSFCFIIDAFWSMSGYFYWSVLFHSFLLYESCFRSYLQDTCFLRIMKILLLDFLWKFF